MNELVIPPSGNWYSDTLLVCTPEGHVVYASRKDIIIVNPAPLTQAAEVHIIHGAHEERVQCVSGNLVTWGKPKKQLVSVGDDKYVKIWNFETQKCEMEHNQHEKNDSPIVSVSFAGERVISVTENGQIVVWHLTTDTKRTVNKLFAPKAKVMCMATCPHAVYLTAFGLASGLVVIADLRPNGKLLYKLREHDHDITGLSWCPTPYNIYRTKSGIEMMDSMKRKPRNYSANENSKNNLQQLTDKALQSPKEKNQEVTETTEENVPNEDFMQKCRELQEKIKQDKENPPKSPKKDDVHISKSSAKTKKEISPDKSITDDDFLGEIVYPQRERPKILDKKNPWGNVVFNDSDEEVEKEERENEKDKKEEKLEVDDFLLECQRIKQRIEQSKEKNEQKEEVCEVTTEGKENSGEVTEEGDVNSDISKQAELESVKDQKEIIEKKEVETSDISIEIIEDMEKLQLQKDEKVHENSLDKNEQEVKITERNIMINPNTLDLTLPDVNETPEFLLASACRAGKICIWRAGTDGHLQIQLPKHMKSSKSYKKRDDRKNWISIFWVQPTLILSSSIWHELLMWDILPKPNNQKCQIKSSLVHADHNKYIFTIASPYQLFEKPENENWRTNKELYAWTLSQDRWILRTNLSTKCNLSSYFTFGGNVNCISVSQLDPNRLAFACGDGSIRIWDLSRPHTQTITSAAYFDKVHSKATCIDWHPTKENFLAFSTSEGRIGEYDLTNRSKNATIYSQYHRGEVHKLQWGPLMGMGTGDEEKYGIYSCSYGEFIVHDSSKPTKEPIQLDVFEEERTVVNFSWKADYSVLAVGSKNGAVRLLNNKFQLIQTLYMQKKSVRNLEWHPLATASDCGMSEYANTLAVSTKESEIYVYDCLNKHGDADSKVKHYFLKGHKSSVKCISWCPHISGRLVSCDEYNVSIVWDIKTQNMISVFYSKNDSVISSLTWSPLDADLIISGSNIMRIWRITKNPPKLPDYKSLQPKQNSNKKKLVKISAADIENREQSVPHKKGKNFMFHILKSALKNENALGLCRMFLSMNELHTKDILDEKVDVEKDKSDSEDENFEDAKENNEIVGQDDRVAAMKIFGNKKEVLSVLNNEQMHHLQNKKIKQHGFASLWKGNLTDTIKHAIEFNEITPWLINMAPMVSHKVWLELCEKYANILCEKEEYLEASTYYLSCHKVDAAIDALCQGNYYTEALSLAKIRLPEGNEQVSLILEKWLKYSVSIGSYEIAALLYLQTGKYKEAAEILNKRSDLEPLKIAAEIAEKIQNKDLLNTINTKISELENTAPTICESRLEALTLSEQKNDLPQIGKETNQSEVTISETDTDKKE